MSRLGEVSDEDAKKAAEEREGRFQALEDRIKSVMDRASGAQAHAASVGIELPERAEAEGAEPKPEKTDETKEPDEQPTDEQEGVEPAEPRRGFFERRADKKPARQKAAGAKKETRAKAAQKRKEKATAAKSKAQAKRASRSSAASRPAGPLDVNKATFEQWRGLGMSVTEATRVIAYRERKDGFESVDGLDRVPGIPKKLLDEIKDQLTA